MIILHMMLCALYMASVQCSDGAASGQNVNSNYAESQEVLDKICFRHTIKLKVCKKQKNTDI